MSSSRTTLVDHVSWRKIDESAVLLNLETSEYYTFNATGCRLLELLSQDESAENMAAALSAEYSVSPQEALADVRKFFSRLKDDGLTQGRETLLKSKAKAPPRPQARRRGRYESPAFKTEGQLSEVAAAFKP